MFRDLFNNALVVSPKEFLDLYKDKDGIQKVEYIYPELGVRDFGAFRVYLKSNHYPKYGKRTTSKARF